MGFTRWDAKLPAIPVSQSDLIALGEIVEAQARVSQARLSLYSEFTMRVKSVLKNSTATAIAAGSTITADRHIGGIEFPSGTIGYFGQVGMGAPEVGKAYVLFLAADQGSPDFRIVTGFELTDGKAYAMDGVRAVPAQGHHLTKFDAYNGTDEAAFIELLQKQVANSRQ